MAAEFPAHLSALGISTELLPRYQKFLDLLKAANQRVSLISYTNDQELYFSHLLDSLMVLADPVAANLGAVRVIDVGTGGGFPGFPLAIARPAWSLTLLDSVQKKERVVAGLARHMGQTNVKTLLGRAEDLAKGSEREGFDVALCRAVGVFSAVLELTLPLVKVGGYCFLHRGADGPGDAARAEAALTLLGGKVAAMAAYRLPGLDKDRFIVRVDKIRPTHLNLPRRAGMPAKRPL